MLRITLIPLSYAAGMIISHFTKEELIIRKKWLKYWPCLLAIIPLTLLINIDLSIIIISMINYIKASNDYMKKIFPKKMVIENFFFLLIGIIVVNL